MPYMMANLAVHDGINRGGGGHITKLCNMLQGSIGRQEKPDYFSCAVTTKLFRYSETIIIKMFSKLKK